MIEWTCVGYVARVGLSTQARRLRRTLIPVAFVCCLYKYLYCTQDKRTIPGIRRHVVQTYR